MTAQQVALITGASSGIGHAIAHALAAQNMAVALWDRDERGLGRMRDELHRKGHRSVQIACLDISERASVQRAASKVEETLGPIDALAMAAGILHMGTALTVSCQAWQETFAVNTQGAFNVTNAVVPHMVERQRGAVVAVASNAARVPRLDMAAYAASKAALVMYMKCLGLEVASRGVRCNVVSPGSTDTPMQRALWIDESGPARVIAGDLSRYRLGIPLQRIAQPEDIAELVCFLLSARARHITMEDICIDGGATLGG